MQIAGKRAVVVGRSNIVGTPAAQLLQRRDATVTVVHSRTPDGAAICAEADIVIAACGRAEMLTGDWIKPGAVVIDVGINAVDVSDCCSHFAHMPATEGAAGSGSAQSSEKMFVTKLYAARRHPQLSPPDCLVAR